MAQLGWSAKADVDPRPAPIDWGSAPVERVEPAGPPLRIGAYVTNISDIDLLQDQFSVEMLLWTTWAGDPQADSSDQLMILNGIYDGDIQRFERVIADGSYQRLVEETIMTPWLRRQLKLRSRRILVLQNPEAADVLADVNPDHWIIPWNDLLSGRITSGNDLGSSSGLKWLCVNWTRIESG